MGGSIGIDWSVSIPPKVKFKAVGGRGSNTQLSSCLEKERSSSHMIIFFSPLLPGFKKCVVYVWSRIFFSLSVSLPLSLIKKMRKKRSIILVPSRACSCTLSGNRETTKATALKLGAGTRHPILTYTQTEAEKYIGSKVGFSRQSTAHTLSAARAPHDTPHLRFTRLYLPRKGKT